MLAAMWCTLIGQKRGTRGERKQLLLLDELAEITALQIYRDGWRKRDREGEGEPRESIIWNPRR